MTHEERTAKIRELIARIEEMTYPTHPHIYAALGIPARYRSKALDGLRPEQIDPSVTAVAARAAEEGRNIVITGSVGAGKTHMAVALLWLAVKKRIEVGIDPWGEATVTNRPWEDAKFLAAIDLQEQMRSAPWKEHEAIAPYTGLQTLLLDDVGAEQRNETTRTWMAALIDRRYRAQRQTIVTTNLTLEELAAAIDDRAVSRIVEGGVHVRIQAPDYRLKDSRRAQ